MNATRLALITISLAAASFAQQAPTPVNDSSTPKNTTMVRGCLDGERGNYIVVENGSGMTYALKGVGNKLDSYRRHEVEVKGRILSGTIKTGVRPEKAGSNPADTVHGVDGVPFQVANIQTDIKTVAKHCKAADQE